MATVLNIAQVVASVGNGGLERHVLDLSQGLAARGHKVTLFAPPPLAEKASPGVTASALPLHLGRRNPWILIRLLRALRKHHFDVVHAQGNKAAYLVAWLRVFMSQRLVVVGTLHNQKTRVGIVRKLDHVIVPSRTLADNVGSNAVSVVHHGLKAPSHMVSHVSLARGKRPLCLAIGRLVAAKGFDLLIAAWHDIDADLLILGSGPERDALLAIIEHHALADRVRLLGHVTDIKGYLKAADGVIVPSRREGFSYVVAEALLAERPVLATDVPVANEVLNRSLWLPADSAAMATVIRKWTADVDAWRAECKSAFAFARAQFSFDRMVHDTETVYRRVLAASTLPPKFR